MSEDPAPKSLGHRLQRRAASLVGSPFFWILSLSILFIVPMGRTMALDAPHPPEAISPFPPFTLTSEQGLPYGLDNLRGRVWVADFVFTSCPTVCPKLTLKMADIQHRGRNLGDAFHLVTFTVDPENDTPEKLAAYAKSYHANPQRWTFLTGPLERPGEDRGQRFQDRDGERRDIPGQRTLRHLPRREARPCRRKRRYPRLLRRGGP